MDEGSVEAQPIRIPGVVDLLFDYRNVLRFLNAANAQAISDLTSSNRLIIEVSEHLWGGPEVQHVYSEQTLALIAAVPDLHESFSVARSGFAIRVRRYKTYPSLIVWRDIAERII
jgi:hypothetical protein